MLLSWLSSLAVVSEYHDYALARCLADSSLPSVKARLRVIFRATKTHALNLAKFVSVYKTLLLLQKKVNGGKERSADTFIAGLLGGYAVFGERSAVNEQVSSCALLDSGGA